MSTDHDYCVTSYRCHAQALLCDIDPNELMAELYGKVTGNVRGKGGSMHFFSKEKKMLGGHGIVGEPMRSVPVPRLPANTKAPRALA